MATAVCILGGKRMRHDISTGKWLMGIVIYFLFGLAVVVAALAMSYWYKNHDRPEFLLPPVNVTVPAAPAPEVAKKETVAKPILAKTVKVYPAAVKNNLKLPQHVLDDPELDVLAASQVPADNHPRTITTVLDRETGESETYVKRDPLPWFDDRKSGSAGIYAMYGNTGPFARLQVRQELFQVKALHVGVMATYDQSFSGNRMPSSTAIGVGAEFHW